MCELDAMPFRSVDEGKAVEFLEGVWENAEFIDVVSGYPILTRRPSGRPLVINSPNSKTPPWE